MDGTPEKIHPTRAENQRDFQESLIERLCDFKIYAISVLSFIGSVCTPDKATLTAENHALQCTVAGPYNAIPSNLLGVDSVCGLGPDLVGIHSISIAARYRVAACSTTLSQGTEKIQTARGHNCAPIFALSPVWEKGFLAPSMAYSTANAFDIICRLDRDGKLDEVPQNKSRKLPLDYFVTTYTSKTLLGLFPFEPPESWDRSVDIELRTSCST